MQLHGGQVYADGYSWLNRKLLRTSRRIFWIQLLFKRENGELGRPCRFIPVLLDGREAGLTLYSIFQVVGWQISIQQHKFYWYRILYIPNQVLAPTDIRTFLLTLSSQLLANRYAVHPSNDPCTAVL